MLLLSTALLSSLTLLPVPQDGDATIPGGKRALEPMDLFQLEGVANPTVSPDGKRVLYTRVGFDVMNDRNTYELWLYDVESGDQRPILAGVGGASWSPSGDHIAYVKGAGDDGAEIFVRWMDDGTTRQVTRLDRSPRSISWSPDGRRIAFTMEVARESKSLASMPSAPKGAKWADPPKVIERFSYRGDGSGYYENTDSQMFVVEAQGGTPRQLTDAHKDHDGPLVWLDDATILFSANLRDDRHDAPTDSDLYTIDVASGSLTKRTERNGPDGGPTLDRTTGELYWTGYDDRKQGHQQPEISRTTLDWGTPEVLTADFDRIPSGVKADGGSLYFSFNSEGNTWLVRQSGGEMTALDAQLYGMGSGRPYAGGSFDVRGGTVAYVGGSDAWPGELHVLRNEQSVQVTDVNADLREVVQLGDVNEQWTTSGADGRKVQSWIITPPDHDSSKTYPMVLEIHGGPFLAYGPQFSFELQLMAAKGYVVVYGNPRGSTSYGETFCNAIHHAYPSQDYDDLMSMVDGALDAELVDPKRLFVTGGSGGGVLTAWIVGKTNRFAAAVVAKPVINWLSFALTSDAYSFYWQYWFPAAPWDEPMHYWNRSPLSLVGNVSTPTMLLTGEEDFRTPISESEQYYQALKIRGVETALVRIPGAGHGIASKPSRLLGKVLHILAWFERERDQ